MLFGFPSVGPEKIRKVVSRGCFQKPCFRPYSLPVKNIFVDTRLECRLVKTIKIYIIISNYCVMYGCRSGMVLEEAFCAPGYILYYVMFTFVYSV